MSRTLRPRPLLVVCKTWNAIINRCELLQVVYLKLQRRPDSLECARKPMAVILEEMAMKNQRFGLEEGQIDVDQWKALSLRVDQCRMKRGMIVAGVGDKVNKTHVQATGSQIYISRTLGHASLVIRELQMCGRVSRSGYTPLIDFDFDESMLL